MRIWNLRMRREKSSMGNLRELLEREDMKKWCLITRERLECCDSQKWSSETCYRKGVFKGQAESMVSQ